VVDEGDTVDIINIYSDLRVSDTWFNNSDDTVKLDIELLLYKRVGISLNLAIFILKIDLTLSCFS
jgi:hypothetical protein